MYERVCRKQRRCAPPFSAIPEKPVGAVKMTPPPNRAKVKEASVKPIFKNKGSPSNYSAYRPISLLSTLSKVFEKIVYKRMYSHFTENALSTEKQSGYRRHQSAQHQLLY